MLFSLLLASVVAMPGPVWALDLDRAEPDFSLHHGARVVTSPAGKVLEFTSALQFAEVPFRQKLDGVEAVTVGGWFYPRRYGEQCWRSIQHNRPPISRGCPTSWDARFHPTASTC